MNRLEHLLTIMSEECAEFHQATSKALRFGLDEGRDIAAVEYGNNLERMQKEFNDILALVEMVNDELIKNESPRILHFNRTLTDAKIEKVEKYLLYSKECGTLDNNA